MRRLLALAAMAVPLPANAAADDWQLVWSDEFTGPAIDTSKWSFDVDCWGGGNNERQCYTDHKDNARIVDGALVITALHERVSGPALPASQRANPAKPGNLVTRDYTSARLTTRGKAAWRYGRIEVRASLPQGQGTWPAIWMLPEANTYGPWAASGEIDILEAVNLGVPCKACDGGKEDTILGTLHFGKPWPGNTHKGDEVHKPAVLEGFHTYAIAWEPDRITWQIDGDTYAVRQRNEWFTSGSPNRGAPFDQPFHLILNLAFGGGLAESRGIKGVSNSNFPKRFLIDWVRVWQRPPQAAGITPAAQQRDQ
ncbi:glycoside hydrolase family 16 protein [Novosphingobium sp.]|uniref:glycoside hydrolase family 16 protein n=1 Tax=Novosphingobium sp. TaxID=1874826 RepID=UPI002603D305|nr:glycoside hydrolase family 16 protein [Novosphingobium sp.]